MPSHIRLKQIGLPEAMRKALVESRRKRGWSQAELGKRLGLPQMHVSSIETGRVIPRFDTLLDLVRILEFDLLLVPRRLVPVVQSLMRADQTGESDEERPLYALDDEDEEDR